VLDIYNGKCNVKLKNNVYTDLIHKLATCIIWADVNGTKVANIDWFRCIVIGLSKALSLFEQVCMKIWREWTGWVTWKWIEDDIMTLLKEYGIGGF
jgi:hypothetical protein